MYTIEKCILHVLLEKYSDIRSDNYFLFTFGKWFDFFIKRYKGCLFLVNFQ